MDITRIDDRRVVCTTWSYVFKDLVDNLLGTDKNYKMSSIIKDNENHHYIKFITKDNKELELDPTKECKEFFFANRGFDFELGYLKGTMYSEQGKSQKDNNKTLKMMLDNINDDYNCTYIDYLKLVKEELIQKYQTNNFNNLNYTQLNEIFTYVLTTTSFNGIGLIEAKSLIYKILTNILGFFPEDKEFFSERVFGFFTDDCYYDLHVPKNDEDNEVYRLTRKGTNDINYQQIYTYKREGNFNLTK